MNKEEITSELVARLISDQFPQWADQPITPVESDGCDNSSFRLGDTLSVRLPRADAYASQIDKEHRWLPLLARHLPLTIPEPVALGRPDSLFPRPWSIYRWIEGEPATVDRIADLTAFAVDLAGFLAALHEIDATVGPPAGAHNFFRGGPLRVYDAQSGQSIQLLAGEIDECAAADAWRAALASTWDLPPVWIHGDVAPSNLLVAAGSLRAVIDFGCAGVGDPACDLAIAWTFLTKSSREAFRHRLGVDAATWARGRGWALWKALVTLTAAEERGTHTTTAATPRFGWRLDARDVVNEVLADHAATT